MKTNEELQKDVQEAIKWEPLLNAAEIGVTVKDGVVTLTGVVDGYSKKLEAEDATKKVAGVKAVVEKIEVKYGISDKKSDTEIATAVLTALKWNLLVPEEKVKIKVENGWITLEGEFEWNYQKNAAKDVISNLSGVTGVTNRITIKTLSNDQVEKRDIERAIARNWSLSGLDIKVKVAGNVVTLEGKVDSWYQKEEAQKLANNASGVWEVKNELIIDYDFAFID